MADTHSPLDRIDAAIARIEAAARARDTKNHDLAQRHADLRSRIGAAIDALDELLPAGAE
ncbi:hypothetical protein BH09PSE4_BH09PSE4_07130 [soil metagenome]